MRMGAEWEALVSSDVVIAIVVVWCVALIVAVIWFRRFSPMAAAKRVVELQFDVAPQRLVDEFFELAKASGREREFLSEVVKIRTAYGHQGLKFGHLMWIDMKLEGRVANDAVAPPFDKPQGKG